MPWCTSKGRFFLHVGLHLLAYFLCDLKFIKIKVIHFKVLILLFFFTGIFMFCGSWTIMKAGVLSVCVISKSLAFNDKR